MKKEYLLLKISIFYYRFKYAIYHFILIFEHRVFNSMLNIRFKLPENILTANCYSFKQITTLKLLTSQTLVVRIRYSNSADNQ